MFVVMRTQQYPEGKNKQSMAHASKQRGGAQKCGLIVLASHASGPTSITTTQHKNGKTHNTNMFTTHQTVILRFITWCM